ncbi:glycosyltransferase [Sabulilitoribacter multivorans]|uniref:Glycosyltransferase n=1 Tax=Flaviramulus multivorans TaxID=1304750 RepID=A0ABS9IJ40_9FLAO|nr:glycosyltransferase [Flaviramulus multivorans]MCF7560422.1 glycosyltransferase [Flaviramulus multivorans]
MSKKICLITTSLANGGAQRFCASLSKVLDRLGHEVHIVTTKDFVDYEFSGSLFNLEQTLEGSNSTLKKIKILKKYFRLHDFDYIIDNRTRSQFLKEFFLYRYIFKAKKIISIVHSHYLKNYLPKSVFLAKLIYNNNYKIVAVSNAILNTVINKYKFKNCVQIYNPIDLSRIQRNVNEAIEVKENYILFYGRIEESVKNLTLLLNAYKKSVLWQNNIKLKIVGDGKDTFLLKEKISEFQLENDVILTSYIKNPFPFVKKALFTTLTSRHEGFPMVLIESLACETPVISVDCKSGPKEIIKHENNGLLVENHNPEALAKAFDSFVLDKELYHNCKKNAKSSINKFSIENISKEWEKLLV